jgi:hypothetical protein
MKERFIPIPVLENIQTKNMLQDQDCSEVLARINFAFFYCYFGSIKTG